MENIARVTAHARARLSARGTSDLERRVLTLWPTRTGATYAQTADGQVFRAFEHIANSVALNEPGSASVAYEAGRALGEFAHLMADLPAPLLHTTLPDFHAPEKRFLQLAAAIAHDPVGRALEVQPEWQSISAREPLAYECATWTRDPQLRLRVTHNDTKLNNVLFDAQTRSALCVIDLDTVMPGYLAFDFGDLVRTCVSSVAEDAEQPGGGLHFDYFEALARGYLSELSHDLTPLEHESLARGPLWIVLELAMRFLTDYVNGDRYFKIQRPDHNLVRARAQLRLLSELERHQTQLAQLLDAARSSSEVS
jgi:Ser/Thr protein kinase RdoA (MazF antagonist)